MLDNLAPIDEAGRLGLAIAMAVFMGLAFEGVYKREQHTSPGGIRTFPLLAALGAMLFLLDARSLLPFIAGLAAVAIWLYAHIQRATSADDERPSLMIPTANLLAYTFGPVALTQPPWIVVAAAVTAVLLLEGREQLHRLVLQVAPDEVFTLGKFLILVGIVLPLLPNHPIVAWTPITPFQVWLAVVAISTLSYASYLLQRYLPMKAGALLPAILGGIYSSTATTVALARRQKAAGAADADIGAGIIVATAIMYLRIDVVVAIFNLSLARVLLPALAGLFALGSVSAYWQWSRRERSVPAAIANVTPANPLQLGTALTFAMLFVIVALASAWVGASFGQRGLYALAAITGITDINPFVLSLAQGGVGGMSLRALATAILIAVASNNMLNACYALLFGGVRACLRPALVLFSLGVAALVASLLYLQPVT
ncbi:MAG: MgtC/SapB family protein [Steroidobacterales bacterium]